MVLGVQPFDGVVRMRAVLPFVAMHPNPQLEFQAVGDGLLANEAQHFEVAVALGLWQIRRADVVAGDGEEERVGEEEVGVGDGAQKIVADAEAELKAAETVFRQHGQVTRPHLAVIEPGFVFDLAGEKALHATDNVGGTLCGSLRQGRCAGQGAGCDEKVAAIHKRIVALWRAGLRTKKSAFEMLVETDNQTRYSYIDTWLAARLESQPGMTVCKIPVPGRKL